MFPKVGQYGQDDLFRHLRVEQAFEGIVLEALEGKAGERLTGRQLDGRPGSLLAQVDERNVFRNPFSSALILTLSA
jgi:hypothetical protein